MSKPFRLLGPAAVTLALAFSAPAATAMPVIDAPVHDATPATPLHMASGDTAAATSNASFDWGSAAVGGGGVLVVVALITAGLAVAGRARLTTTR